MDFVKLSYPIIVFDPPFLFFLVSHPCSSGLPCLSLFFLPFLPSVFPSSFLPFSLTSFLFRSIY